MPEVGSQCRFTANSTISIKPSQNPGIAWPTTPIVNKMRSSGEPSVTPEINPVPMPTTVATPTARSVNSIVAGRAAATTLAAGWLYTTDSPKSPRTTLLT